MPKQAMSSQTFKQLREPPSAELARKSTLDVLNDKFADCAHLSDLPRARDDARNTQGQLEQQRMEQKERAEKLTATTQIEAILQLDKAKELAELRDNLEDDLAYLSHDLVSVLSPTGDDNVSTLLEDIETMHRALKELESVRSYVVVVERTLQLGEAALSQMRDNSSPITKVATSSYQALLAFVNDVKRLCTQVEDIGNSHGSLNLISFLERTCDKTWGGMKEILFSTLISASENLDWPTTIDYVSVNKENRTAFESAVFDLLRLQEIGESFQPPRAKEGLYILQALVRPVALRFRYHFDSERETNRLDKPEWYFTHIINVIHDHRPFMEGVMQRLISASKLQDVNAWRNYVTLLLPILERKLKRSVPMLLTRPALLAHTVYQSLIFDSSLRNMGYEFRQDEREVQDNEKKEIEQGGISKVILDQTDWFNAWLEGEKKFANDQYHDIISASDAWAVSDDDKHESEQNYTAQNTNLKVTNSARRIKTLVEQVTDRYSPLPSFRQRTQFLIHAQLPILELYHSRISSSLDAFETLSSALVRAVPGALGVDGPKTEARNLTGGVEGSQRLCKALLSARYIEDAMRVWGEDVFFLELWTEINHRASFRVTASALPERNVQSGQGTTSEGTIFEELVAQFVKLCSRAEDMLVQQICGECEGSLKSHFSALAAHVQGPSYGTDEVVVPSTLLPAAALLSSHLTSLQSIVPAPVVTRLYRRIASRTSEYMLQRQVLFRPGLARGSGRIGLTRTQARVIQAECELWPETSQVAMNMSRTRIETPWGRLLAAGRLLGADMQKHERLLDAVFGDKTNGWEELIDNVTELGTGGLGLDEVRAVLRLRDDCRR